MAKSGRPRKQGKRRYPNGRIKAVPHSEPVFLKGNDRIEAMRERFGSYYNSALGRAFAAGLLGEGQEALSRYQAARKFVKLHARFYGAPAYTCPLDQTPRGNVVDLHNVDFENNRKQLRWLEAASDAMDVAGVRPYLDQLLSVVNVDSGPHWLNALLDVLAWNAALPSLNAARKKEGFPLLDPRMPDHRDGLLLNAAIRALDIIAPEVRPVGILVSVA